jgi:hypothetical protein
MCRLVTLQCTTGVSTATLHAMLLSFTQLPPTILLLPVTNRPKRLATISDALVSGKHGNLPYLHGSQRRMHDSYIPPPPRRYRIVAIGPDGPTLPS